MVAAKPIRASGNIRAGRRQRGYSAIWAKRRLRRLPRPPCPEVPPLFAATGLRS